MSQTCPQEQTPSQPIRAVSILPAQPIPRPARLAGRLRIPLAGPYRPWARLFCLPDGRLLWTVRLWEVDRPVRRIVSTSTLVTFAHTNRLPVLAARIRTLAALAPDDAEAP